jgi:pyridoxal phosphate enzyme (YggS family)
MNLEANLIQIKNEMQAYPDAKLIAVSKYATSEQMKEAYALGIRDFGENYIVPALKKRKELALPNDVIWHLLGTIQKNKINKVVGSFDLIHSVHSEEIAELINNRAAKLELVQDILLQIDLTDDKSGFKEEEFEEAYLRLSKLKNINIKGLMLMNYHQVSQKSETNFKRMRQLLEMMSSHHTLRPFELSMGMTNDYRLALKFGSTYIRVGRGLFGEIGSKI